MVTIASLPLPVLEALITVGRLAAGSTDAGPALTGIADHLARLAPHDGLAIVAPAHGRRELALARGVTSDAGLSPLLARALDRALEIGAAVIIVEEQQMVTDGAEAEPPAREAVLVVPFGDQGQVTGALALLRRGEEAAFQPGDLAIVEAFGDLAAVSLTRARLYLEACARAEALARLQEISLALNADLDPRRVLERIVAATTELTGALFTSVMLVDAEGMPRDYVTDDPLTSPNPLHRRDSFRPNGTTATVLRTGQPVVVEDVARDDRVNPVLRQRGVGAVIGMPLLIEGAATGVLWVNFAAPRRPAAEEIGLLATLAAQAATALRNAHLYVEARQLADRDPLTSLVNYRALQERLRQQMAVARRTGEPLSIVMVDLNDFKQVNDSLGHLAGDALLRRVAAALVAACRESDVVGRYGGDEFLLVLPHTDAAGARALIARVAEQLTTLPREMTLPAPPTLAAGAATFPSEATEVEALVALADARLYASKPTSRRPRSIVRPLRRSVVRRGPRPAPPR